MDETPSMLLRAGWLGGKGILMFDSEIPVMEAILIGARDPEIVAVEARLRVAQLNADVNALDQLIADDLLFTGPDGNLATKADDLAAHRSGLVRFRKHEPEELRIRRVGADIAIAALRARLTVEIADTTSSGTYRYTRVWGRETDGSWRVVGGHVSPCAPPR
jgi:ketosteroid isomerase-like protein